MNGNSTGHNIPLDVLPHIPHSMNTGFVTILETQKRRFWARIE